MNNELHKKNLEQELKKVEAELKTVGHINPKNKEDWEANSEASDVDKADEEEVAEKIESYEENNAILEQLEIKVNEIKAALEKIEDNTYGICNVCGKQIEEERLEANEAAATCMAHMK